jgi:CheY-like chemotaxis protein
MVTLCPEWSHPGTARPPCLRVLVVDDYCDAAESLALLLRLWGHDVRIAVTGSVAVSLAQAYRPDMVFAEVRLAGLSGYQVARCYRTSSTARPPVLVALTTQASEADRQQAREAGFDHFLTKPADPAEVETLVRHAAQEIEAAMPEPLCSVGSSH